MRFEWQSLTRNENNGRISREVCQQLLEQLNHSGVAEILEIVQDQYPWLISPFTSQRYLHHRQGIRKGSATLKPLLRGFRQVKSNGKQGKETGWRIILRIKCNPTHFIGNHLCATQSAYHSVRFAIAAGGFQKKNATGCQCFRNPDVELRAIQRVRRNRGNMNPVSEQLPDELTPLETTVGRLEFIIGCKAIIEWFHALPHLTPA